MRRTGLITLVLAPFAFAVLPLAALIMTPGAPGPVTTTVEVRQALEAAPGISGRMPDSVVAATEASSGCSAAILES
jgi:hypothetical protein